MVKSPILFLNTNERDYEMDIQKKRSVTESEIQQMKDLAYICGQQDNLDYSSDLHINFLKNRNEDYINDFLLYNGTQLIGALNMYDFERPTKLELIGFVHPHFRKQRFGTILLQTAMKEIQNRETDEALLIINGDSMSGNEFVKHMKLPYLYSEYSMEFKTNEIQKQQIIIYSLLLQLQNHFLILLKFLVKLLVIQ